MTITVVIGGQYGSEGKGEFIHWLVNHHPYRAVVRTGGPNAGHTMTVDGQPYKMRQIPCGWGKKLRPHTDLMIGPGSLIEPELLNSEVEMVRRQGYEGDIVVDHQAIVMTQDYKEREQVADLRGKLGSTAEGIGAARANHVMRNAVLYGDLPSMEVHPDVMREDVSDRLNTLHDSLHTTSPRILIESTQGFGLSLTASGHYPFVTSRDITPGSILSDAGLSSRLKHEVIAVVRTHPIRVAGNSGPLQQEMQWDNLQESVPHIKGPERTTVTNLPRRIGAENTEELLRMRRVVRPDMVCLTFTDYWMPGVFNTLVQNMTEWDRLRLWNRVRGWEDRNDMKVGWVSTGPGVISARKLSPR